MGFAFGGYQRVAQEEDQKPRPWISCFFSRSSLYVGLAFITGALLTFLAMLPLLMRNIHQTPNRPRKPPSSAIPQEVFSPMIPTAWVPDERYIGYSKYANLRWHQLVQSTESVWIRNPSEYSLGDGFEASFNHTSKSDSPAQFYHVSNLHQLHCLNIIRGQYFELYYNVPSLSKQSEIAAADTRYHMDHCIEYLRMSIMCGGSWDIESNSPPGTPHELRIDPFGHPIGWGGVRNCVNWDALVTWQKKQLDAYKGTWSEFSPDHIH